ncbi:Cupredoxin [Desarmillaria ectypa]|nr:Cupredoxin [Desarmillaria ectypa]
MRLLSVISTALIAAPLVMGVDWTVQVGLSNGFTFTPNEIHPTIGDTVTFTYLTRNHTATTTTFTSPCPPPVGGVGPSAFDSGFHDAVSAPGSTFTTTILDTEPHWISCRQAAGAHCRLGMTLAINPTADQTEAQFMANARAS